MRSKKKVHSFMFLLSALLLFCSTGFICRAQAVPEAPIVLDTVWEMQLGIDYTSSTSPTERNLHPHVGIFYIPSQNKDSAKVTIPGLVPLYRLLNQSATDHMDSTIAGEGGFTTEGILGYVWSNGAAKPGISGLTRYYDIQPQSPNAGDHATVVDPSPVAHSQALSYYALDVTPLGYGYVRYPGTDRSLASVSGGGVEVKSNVATGCAVWEWWWHGIEFINDYDYGRQLSTAMYPDYGSPRSALQEAGDQYGYGDPGVLNVDTAHPAPCVSIKTSGSSQSTAAVPLDWNPASFGGGLDNPVIYPDVTIGKTITLDWVGPDRVDRNWPVALYQTVITAPSMSGSAVVEAPTGYLNSPFNYYYYYQATNHSFTPVSYSTVQAVSGSTGYDVPGSGSGPQAVILASGSAPTSPAMGVFMNSPNAGFVFYDNSTGGCISPPVGSSCQYSSNFTKWEVHYDGGITPGPWTFNTWVMTDTLQNVESYINQFNTWGVKSR